jgi:hypothetical protein
MAVSVTIDHAYIPGELAIVADREQPANVWHGLRLGLERGVPLAVAFIGGLSFLEFQLGFGWVVDFIAGALLLFALYHGLNGLVTLGWKLVRLAAKGVGALVGRRSEDPAWRARALSPHRFLSQVRGQSIGAIIAPIAIIFMDKIKIGEMSMISQPAVTESLLPFLVVACALVGVALAGGVGRRAKVGLIVLAAAVVAAPVAWYAWPGTTGYLAQPNTEALAAMPRFTFENPGQTGPYTVRAFSYGSGAGRRAEFAGEADFITPTVDATPAYKGWEGMPAGFYKWVFGRDFAHLPLNGLVWMPEGEGPFPIVLIVHGNHAATDYSDPGYAYLGQHFASRGFITVSVDENFLNGHALWDGKGEEMPIRAWLLLKHLQVWREWNAEPGNPLYGKVDLDRVALMGHSRGAEAATHAAMLNNKVDRPLTAVAKDGEFDFGIRGVVAIAPPDGQYKPYGRERKLLDVSYLLLQGGHDQDLSSAIGMRQYSRTRFESNPDAFKAVAYVYRANHGNYNTVWGGADHGPSASMLLNRAGLLAAEEQRTTGRVFMTAFLEATLHDEADYRKVFIAPAAARDWLPNDIYVTQYQDASFKVVNTHDRLGRLESAELKQARVQTSGLSKPLQSELPLRDGQMQGNRALVAQWDAGANPGYTLALPQGGDAEFAVSADDRLVFSLGNLMEDKTPLYVTVELVDATGELASQPVSRFGTAPPPLPAKLEKSNRVSKALGSEFFPKVTTPYERMLQSFEIPLSAFVAANANFDPTRVEIIRFRFNDEMGGRMYVDEVGFRG